MNVLKNIEKLLGGCWIAPEEDFGNGVIYFETPVAITAPLTSAKLYVSASAITT